MQTALPQRVRLFMQENQFGNKPFFWNESKRQKGITAVEILTVIFIFGIGITSLFGLFTLGLKNTYNAQQTTKAIAFAQEAMDAAINFRDTTEWATNGFGLLSLDTPYHPEAKSATSGWQLVSGEEIIDQFTRKIVLQAVQRDASGDIVSSGGTVDPNTKKVIVIVTWPEQGINKELRLTTYLTNWRK
jgi:type II secretory pathway pseudopilin PulG